LKLFADLSSARATWLTAEDELTYVIAAAGAKIVFAKDVSGEVTHFTLFQGGGEMRANRVE